MKRNNAQNTSAKKKLIPAVAMFTASAVMLSTATYAWFTMNKNAKVTGLNMTATAGGSIEISLGQLLFLTTMILSEKSSLLLLSTVINSSTFLMKMFTLVVQQ